MTIKRNKKIIGITTIIKITVQTTVDIISELNEVLAA